MMPARIGPLFALPDVLPVLRSLATLPVESGIAHAPAHHLLMEITAPRRGRSSHGSAGVECDDGPATLQARAGMAGAAEPLQRQRGSGSEEAIGGLVLVDDGEKDPTLSLVSLLGGAFAPGPILHHRVRRQLPRILRILGIGRYF
jgi:hypothetical protein